MLNLKFRVNSPLIPLIPHTLSLHHYHLQLHTPWFCLDWIPCILLSLRSKLTDSFFYCLLLYWGSSLFSLHSAWISAFTSYWVLSSSTPYRASFCILVYAHSGVCIRTTIVGWLSKCSLLLMDRQEKGEAFEFIFRNIYALKTMFIIHKCVTKKYSKKTFFRWNSWRSACKVEIPGIKS